MAQIPLNLFWASARLSLWIIAVFAGVYIWGINGIVGAKAISLHPLTSEDISVGDLAPHKKSMFLSQPQEIKLLLPHVSMAGYNDGNGIARIQRDFIR
jgi:hypothetical protein